ncbi:hypothetical protein ACW14X_28140 [Nocardioides sp. YJ-D4]
MPDKLANALMAASRSLREVVGPSISEGSGTAVEQTAVASNILDFYADRAPHEYARRSQQLRINIDLAHALQKCAHVDTTAVELLDPPLKRARELLSGFPSPVALVATTDTLAEAISRAVACSDSIEVHRLALRHSKDLIQLHRAWFAPQGFDPDPSSVPPLEELLYPSVTAQRDLSHQEVNQ